MTWAFSIGSRLSLVNIFPCNKNKSSENDCALTVLIEKMKTIISPARKTK
jgi:hypothetical protein